MPFPSAPLADDEVRVGLTPTDEVTDPALRERYLAMLDDEERAQYARFVFDKDRHIYLVAHALTRVMLSDAAPLPAREWRFERNEHGRPEIAPGLCDDPLRYNLSHTTGLVACALTRGRDVGVDVEQISRRVEVLDIADRFFSSAEVAALRAAPAAQHRDYFFRYWTLKEAYIKARGMGLSIPLGDFSFDLAGPDLTVRFAAALDDDPLAWQFAQSRITDDHYLAVAARRGNGPSCAIHISTVIPGAQR